MELEFSIANKDYSLSIQKKNDHYQLKVGDESISFKADQVTSNSMMLTDEHGTQQIFLASSQEKTFVHLKGRQYVVDHPIKKEKTSYAEDSHLLAADAGICAPMPGKILKILVEENQAVEAKHNLVIVEAMKMEHNIRAPRNGIVKKINFNAGDLVDTGQEILELEFVTEDNDKTEKK